MNRCCPMLRIQLNSTPTELNVFYMALRVEEDLTIRLDKLDLLFHISACFLWDLSPQLSSSPSKPTLMAVVPYICHVHIAFASNKYWTMTAHPHANQVSSWCETVCLALCPTTIVLACQYSTKLHQNVQALIEVSMYSGPQPQSSTAQVTPLEVSLNSHIQPLGAWPLHTSLHTLPQPGYQGFLVNYWQS